MKPDRRVFPFLLALLFGMLALLPAASPALAGGSSYQVIRAPVVKDGAVYELGVVFASFTAAQLQQNDVVTFRLPSDFIWTTAGLKSDENTAAAEAQTTAQWNEVTAS
ncbi:MAG TPA: copper amine oxidase N-terminal domain-containing protein, partial [Peptococcaceae bacterium]|nr:copper amine oxidase N-terminal domain-containing protein [Peptococcaceae bacterium]